MDEFEGKVGKFESEAMAHIQAVAVSKLGPVVTHFHHDVRPAAGAAVRKVALAA